MGFKTRLAFSLLAEAIFLDLLTHTSVGTTCPVVAGPSLSSMPFGPSFLREDPLSAFYPPQAACYRSESRAYCTRPCEVPGPPCGSAVPTFRAKTESVSTAIDHYVSAHKTSKLPRPMRNHGGSVPAHPVDTLCPGPAIMGLEAAIHPFLITSASVAAPPAVQGMCCKCHVGGGH